MANQGTRLGTISVIPLCDKKWKHLLFRRLFIYSVLVFTPSNPLAVELEKRQHSLI